MGVGQGERFTIGLGLVGVVVTECAVVAALVGKRRLSSKLSRGGHAVWGTDDTSVHIAVVLPHTLLVWTPVLAVVLLLNGVVLSVAGRILFFSFLATRGGKAASVKGKYGKGLGGGRMECWTGVLIVVVSWLLLLWLSKDVVGKEL